MSSTTGASTIRPADPRGAGARLGIVIPALDEADALPALLRDLRRLSLPHRIVVADGGSADATIRRALAAGAEVVMSRQGRARQLNAGADFLLTPWLLMLHADSRLDADAVSALERHVAESDDDPGHAGAAYFRLAIDHPDTYYRLIEAGQRLRERRTGLVYGDQGLLIGRDLWRRHGPYPDEPLMEDVILNRRLHRAGRLRPLAATILTSPRRYEEEGRVRGWVRNATLITRFLKGARPADLARRYPPRRRSGRSANPAGAEASGADRRARPSVQHECTAPRAPLEARARPPRSGRAPVLLAFARAPRPGRVKTRLARDVGDRAAARAYSAMGRLVVDQVTPGPWRTVVCHEPADAGAEVREWLGDGPAAFWPQPGGDLGERMSALCDRAFELSDRVVVIGTDAPGLDADLVRRCLAGLDHADVVLGPARDGGYYLMGLGARRPNLFRNIRWSTPSVLAATVARARAEGASVAYLEVCADIDTAADLTPALAERLGLARGASASGECATPTRRSGSRPPRRPERRARRA